MNLSIKQRERLMATLAKLETKSGQVTDKVNAIQDEIYDLQQDLDSLCFSGKTKEADRVELKIEKLKDKLYDLECDEYELQQQIDEIEEKLK